MTGGNDPEVLVTSRKEDKLAQALALTIINTDTALEG